MNTIHRVLSVLLCCLSLNAAADGLFRADFGYVMDDTQSNGSETKNTRQLIDLTGGYIWPEGWTLLGQYAMEKTDAVSGGTTTEGNRTSYGPGFGWISRQSVGAYITGTYYFSSRYVLGGSTYDGWGYQLDLGIKVDIQKVFLVAGMSYESFEYSKLNSAALSPSYKQSHIDPRVGIQIEF